MLFSVKNAHYYVLAFSIIMVASFVGNKLKANFEDKNDEYDMIRKYLLNDSPLTGNNKPKLWIHTKFEYNSRVWASFQSRSSTELNQPYINITIRSIIDHCGDDFHICLIDDDSFSKLIPSWDINVATLAEPIKSQMRNIGLSKLVYFYGGMVVPNTFLCLKPLKNFYLEATADDMPFVCENVNRKSNFLAGNTRLAFLPSTYFMGANKNNETIKDMIEYQKTQLSSANFSSDAGFLGNLDYWCLDKVKELQMNLVSGAIVGVKTQHNKPILLDDLMGEAYLDLSNQCVGIYIPEDELLTRTKYQWFAVMHEPQLLETKTILAKYMKVAMLSGRREHIPAKVRNAISI